MSTIFRTFIYTILFIINMNAYAASRATYFQLNNMSPYTITNLKVDGVDSYDWDGKSRPDRNLNGRGPIYPLQSIREREEINTWSSGSPFNLTLSFNNSIQPIKMRVNMADCISGSSTFTRLTNNNNVSILQYIRNNQMFITVIKKSDQREWMTHLPDDTNLVNLSIPGTHDTASWNTSLSFGQTQDKNFTTQLNDGIRFFDIRVRRVAGGGWALHHGPLYLHLNFNNVLDSLGDFLSKHPKETVIVSIKEDHTPMDDTYSNCQTLDLYQTHRPDVKWYDFSKGMSPALKDVRGKIVLLDRLNCGYGISTVWKDNDVTVGSSITVQDIYKAGSTDKSDAFNSFVENHSGKINPDTNDTYYINFASASTGSCLWIPFTCARDFYPGIYTHMNSNITQRYGIIPADFYNNAFVDYLIGTNYVN